ncbi:unnamed protein product, partial [Polarella glacialis]
ARIVPRKAPNSGDSGDQSGDRRSAPLRENINLSNLKIASCQLEAALAARLAGRAPPAAAQVPTTTAARTTTPTTATTTTTATATAARTTTATAATATTTATATRTTPRTPVAPAAPVAAPVVPAEASQFVAAAQAQAEASREVIRILKLRKDSFPTPAAWGFAVLDVPSTSTHDISAGQRGFRTLMRKLHPDKAGSAAGPGLAQAAEVAREAREAIERGLSLEEPPGAPRNLQYSMLCATAGNRKFKLHWASPEVRPEAPVRRYIVAALDPAYGRPLTAAVLEPDYCEALGRFVSVEDLTSYTLAEQELQKMPSLWQQPSATFHVAAANDKGPSKQYEVDKIFWVLSWTLDMPGLGGCGPPNHDEGLSGGMVLRERSGLELKAFPRELQPHVYGQTQSPRRGLADALRGAKEAAGEPSLLLWLAWRLGWECGASVRALHAAGVAWGTYPDALGIHCNAHVNNLVVKPPGVGSESNFLAALDFDMAFTQENFLPEATASHASLGLDSWEGILNFEASMGMKMVLGGSDFASTGVSNATSAPESHSLVELAMRDTLVAAYEAALKGGTDGHPQHVEMRRAAKSP